MAVSNVGAVVIGRNEGDHLRVCLESIMSQVSMTIYVDSGSSDGSVTLAAGMCADTIELSPAAPFTAARGRNAGWRWLTAPTSDIEYIQFVDGDCVINASWVAHARKELEAQPDLAIVTGHVREVSPRRNVYHRLAAMEWDTPVGVSRYCGGIALIRVSALKEAGGFNDALAAGEEPELCVRLRHAGWRILKVDYEMALHDSDIDSFRQWWQRCVRSGYAYAEGAALHGSPPELHCVRESRSIWFWGGALPFAAIILAWPTSGISILVALGLYLVLFVKILVWRVRRRDEPLSSGIIFAVACVVAKLPQVLGQLLYWNRRVRHTPTQVIEYAPTGAQRVNQSGEVRH